MEQESIRIAEAVVYEICRNNPHGLNPARVPEIAEEIVAALKKSTGVDFKVIVSYDEKQPNILTVGIW